ncbi:MAG: hypothetical protein E1N59_2699 [Puniceicoccaceae bacterium 5H]|nr:MAG: hypothetical protein E1N59_2699 [Puniceicoccaceae bacterium 5H]
MIDPHDLFRLPAGVETRWTSPENWTGAVGAGGKTLRGRKGAPCFSLAAGASRVLAEEAGRPGMLRRIWATVERRDPEVLRGLRIEIFWDGAATPAVNAPWGDFFGQPLGRCATFESALLSDPEGRSFNCCIPMPFRQGMRVVVHNESAVDIQKFYFDVNYTLGDRHPEDMLYFHAWWHREAPTQLRQDFALLPYVEGAGRFLGVVVGVVADKQRYGDCWWGEGECKAYLDGDHAHPTLCGTGTEDYIGTAWGQGQYAHRYQGSHLFDDASGLYGFYRWHVPDPVYFRRSIQVTMQQIGCLFPAQAKDLQARGTEVYSIYEPDEPLDLAAFSQEEEVTLFERQDDWSACAYFYLDRPTNNLPPLAEARSRIQGLSVASGASARMDQ